MYAIYRNEISNDQRGKPMEWTRQFTIPRQEYQTWHSAVLALDELYQAASTRPDVKWIVRHSDGSFSTLTGPWPTGDRTTLFRVMDCELMGD